MGGFVLGGGAGGEESPEKQPLPSSASPSARDTSACGEKLKGPKNFQSFFHFCIFFLCLGFSPSQAERSLFPPFCFNSPPRLGKETLKVLGGAEEGGVEGGKTAKPDIFLSQ